MMRFGTSYKNDTRSSTSRDGWINYFKDPETRIRFLQQMDEWTVYWQHFNASKKRAYPCTEDRDTCPGCLSEDEREAKASKRYLCNTLNQDTGFTNLYAIPVSLIDDLVRACDKDENSITERDYTVIRRNKSGVVEYSLDKEARDNLPLEKYTKYFKDHQQALAEAYVEAWGKLPDGSVPPAPVGEENQDVQPKAKRQPKPEGEYIQDIKDNDPPSEPAPEDDDLELTDDEVRAMNTGQLKDLFKRCGLEVPDEEDATVLAELLMAAVG